MLLQHEYVIFFHNMVQSSYHILSDLSTANILKALSALQSYKNQTILFRTEALFYVQKSVPYTKPAEESLPRLPSYIISVCRVTVRRTAIASKPEKQALSWLKITFCVILSPAHYLMSSSFRPKGRTKVQGFL